MQECQMRLSRCGVPAAELIYGEAFCVLALKVRPHQVRQRNIWLIVCMQESQVHPARYGAPAFQPACG